MDKYYEERTKTLAQAGIYGLTRQQEDAVMEPSEAPENYHCDGEISPDQAYDRWLDNLKRFGLNKDQVKRAVKLMFKK